MYCLYCLVGDTLLGDCRNGDDRVLCSLLSSLGTGRCGVYTLWSLKDDVGVDTCADVVPFDGTGGAGLTGALGKLLVGVCFKSLCEDIEAPFRVGDSCVSTIRTPCKLLSMSLIGVNFI